MTTRLTSPALRRGLDILELLIDHEEGLRVPEITAYLDLPRATTHELVNTLTERGYLTASKDTGRIRLGVSVLQLGAGYERSLDLSTVGRQCAAVIAAQCGETVQVVVRDGSYAVYIARIDSTHSIRLVSSVGSRLPASCTAGGKMLLSMLPTMELNALLPDDAHLTSMTPHSINTRARLDEDLAQTRARGWAWEYCESNEHVTCVAAPVFNRLGECVAAMSISVPVMRWNEEDRERFAAWARQGAAAMTRQLGGSV